MSRPSVLWTTAALVALGVGFFSGSAWRQRAEAGAAGRSDLLSALDRVGNAELTLALLEQERPHELELRSRHELIENIEMAYRAIESGASLGERETIPNLTESFRRATARLSQSGEDPRALGHARAVLFNLRDRSGWSERLDPGASGKKMGNR
jgi:hypothetical protein